MRFICATEMLAGFAVPIFTVATTVTDLNVVDVFDARITRRRDVALAARAIPSPLHLADPFKDDPVVARLVEGFQYGFRDLFQV